MKRMPALAAIAALLCLAPVFAVGPSFRPDGTVKGSSLAGWRPLGQADWIRQTRSVHGSCAMFPSLGTQSPTAWASATSMATNDSTS